MARKSSSGFKSVCNSQLTCKRDMRSCGCRLFQSVRRASVRVGTVQHQESESSEVEEALAGLWLHRGAEAWLPDAIHSGKQRSQDDEKGACNKTCQGQANRPAAQAGNG